MNKIKVLYIAGAGRSGTTLIDRLLGEVDGFVSVGELRHIWSRSFAENQLCACGETFNDCNTWKDITDNAFNGDLSGNKLKRAIDLQKSLNRIRMLPLIKGNFQNLQVAQYKNEFLKPLYSAIQEKFNGNIIVDSSKIPSYLYILSTCNFIDLHVLHVTRDPRAVSYSWLKKKLRPEIVGKTEYMPTITPFRSSNMWIAFNSLILHIGKSLGNTRYKLITYDSFTANPQKSLANIVEFTGKKENISFFTDKHKAILSKSHSVSGNPMRFKIGKINIKRDDDWKNEMSTTDKLLVSMLTMIHRKKFTNP